MKDIAVLQPRFWHRSGLLIALPLAAALLLAGLVESAPAAKLVGNDGKVYACYQVKQGKGKAKGSVRLVTKKSKCKRGERKVSWAAVGPAGRDGEAGATGATGATGAQGASGPAGASALEKQVTELNTRIESLETTLTGVTNETLTQALATVNGITNSELTGALGKLSGISGGQVDELVASLPVLADLPTLESTVAGLSGQLGDVEGLLAGVEGGDLSGLLDSVPVLQSTVGDLGTQVGSLCTQADVLTDQVNAVGGVLDSVIGALTALLGGQQAPDPLGPFICPTG